LELRVVPVNVNGEAPLLVLPMQYK
jgi:hypothetical protein